MKRFLHSHKTSVVFVVLFLALGAVAATSYNNIFSAHLYYSLIDATPIGVTAPSTAAFTTATASQGFTGNLTGTASGAPWGGITGKPYPVNGQNWSYNGQAYTPNWVWGTDDGQNMYVWNPANFSVASAQTATSVPGLAAQRFTPLCSIPTSGSCTSYYTFNLGYSNTNYTVVCNLTDPVGYPQVLGVHKISSTAFQLTVASGTANEASGSASGAECIFKGW